MAEPGDLCVACGKRELLYDLCTLCGLAEDDPDCPRCGGSGEDPEELYCPNCFSCEATYDEGLDDE